MVEVHPAVPDPVAATEAPVAVAAATEAEVVAEVVAVQEAEAAEVAEASEGKEKGGRCDHLFYLSFVI